MVTLGGVVLCLIGVLFLINGQEFWWGLVAIGGFNIFSGGAMCYEYTPTEYSITNWWLLIGFAALVLELGLLVYVAFTLT